MCDDLEKVDFPDKLWGASLLRILDSDANNLVRTTFQRSGII